MKLLLPFLFCNTYRHYIYKIIYILYYEHSLFQWSEFKKSTLHTYCDIDSHKQVFRQLVIYIYIGIQKQNIIRIKQPIIHGDMLNISKNKNNNNKKHSNNKITNNYKKAFIYPADM